MAARVAAEPPAAVEERPSKAANEAGNVLEAALEH
jgi:hypothetical protein